jgi:hypothetical protein
VSQPELLIRVVRALDAAGIAHMVTGSIASSAQGEPRASHDIDLVVVLQTEDVGRLSAEFPSPEYYMDEAAALEAVRKKRHFNLISTRDGDKVDFWLLTDQPFDLARFARRRPMEFHGARVPVSSPEDTILQKLLWARKSGGSEKHFLDALRVYEVQVGVLDVSYIAQWVEALGLAESWKRLLAEALPIQPPDEDQRPEPT